MVIVSQRQGPVFVLKVLKYLDMNRNLKLFL